MRIGRRLLFFALFFLFSCGPALEKDPSTLVWNLGSDPSTLNPITATDATSDRVTGFLFDSLIRRDPQTLEWIPDLATAWEISKDKLQFTFHLRKEVQWQDGKPFTVDDILYSYERIMDPKVDAPHLRNYYKDIKKVEKLDENTVRFTYARPYYLALEFCGGMPIVPKHLFQDQKDFNSAPFSRSPIGTGPYKFVAWNTGKNILLERNENYWNKERFPAIKRINFKFIGDDAVALQALKKGEIDLAGLRPIQWVKQTDSENFKRLFVKHQYFRPNYYYIGWNLRRPFFQDKKVRQALTRLVNRQAIVDKLEFGLGKVISGPFFFQGYENNPKIEPIPYDPIQARKLLDEAGWIDRDKDGIREKNGVPFQFTILIPAGSRFHERLTTLMKEDFSKMGIQMEIRVMEWSSFLGRIHARDFDATALAWSMGLEQDPYQVWHSSQAEKGSNFIGFKNAEADQLIEQARVNFNKEERKKLYHRFHELVHEEQPYTFLFTGPALVARSVRFENVKIYKTGFEVLEWKVSP